MLDPHLVKTTIPPECRIGSFSVMSAKMYFPAREEIMVGRHAECLQLARECINALQDPKAKTCSIVRKLEVIGELVNEDKLKKWCAFQLGAFDGVLPLRTEKETMSDYIKRLEPELDKADLNSVVSRKELSARHIYEGGGFSSIESIESHLEATDARKLAQFAGRHRTNLAKTIATCRNEASRWAVKMYSGFAFGDIPSRQFDVIREQVDNLLLDICPEAIEKFMSAYNMLESKSSEDWSLALTSCRRVIKSVADSLYPPKKDLVNNRKVGEEEYVNRLWAFLDENVPGGSDKQLAKAHVDYLGSFLDRLNAKACKGVHADVTYEEAVRAVLYTYLALGDILQFAGKGVAIQLKGAGKLNINEASIDELASLPGVTRELAKSIIKRRSKQKYVSVDELAELKGVGPKSIEKLRSILVALV